MARKKGMWGDKMKERRREGTRKIEAVGMADGGRKDREG